MNKFYFLKINIFIVLTCLSCIDPININVDSDPGNLVVDGLITDKDGPHTIKLGRSVSYFDRSSNPLLNREVGATLQILSSSGQLELLNEVSPGTYETSNNFKGTVGESYVLTIQLTNGKIYQSEPEIMTQNVGIDSLILSYDFRNITNKNNIVLQVNGVNVEIRPNSIESANSYYRWRYSSIHEIKTFPELRTKNVEGGTIPDPPPCSGYIVAIDGRLQQIANCTCCECWVSEFSSKVITSKLNFVEGFINADLAFIEDVNGIFSIRYFIEVEQLSLSRSAHEFWTLLEAQQNQGSLFDQPAGRINSNVFSTDDPEEIVLGYFGASSSEKISRFIDPAFFPVRITQMDSIKNDCRQEENASSEKPSFW